MHNFAFALACLAFVGHGRRVHQSAERLLATLLAEHRGPAAAFNSASPGARFLSGNPSSPGARSDRRNRLGNRLSAVSMQKKKRKDLPKGKKLGDIAQAEATKKAGVKVNIKTKSSETPQVDQEPPWFENEMSPAPAPVEMSSEVASEASAPTPAQAPLAPLEPEASPSMELTAGTAEAAPEGRELAPTEGQELEPKEKEMKLLTLDDLVNTKWVATITPRNNTWMPFGFGRVREFVLLGDGSVVWPTVGKGGGFSTGGKWEMMAENILEVEHWFAWGTSLGLFIGRDAYVTDLTIRLTDDLQFKVIGFIRSYNAVMPFQTIADFEAIRQPGRFVMNNDDDEEK